MSLGSKSTPIPQPNQAASVFKNTRQVDWSGPFGSSTTRLGSVPLSASAKAADAAARKAAEAKARAAGYGGSSQIQRSMAGWEPLYGRPGVSPIHARPMSRVGAPSSRKGGRGPITDDVLKQFGYKKPVSKTKLTTDMSLSPNLEKANQSAQLGLSNNLDFLQLTPQEQYEAATGGNNPLYNLLMEEDRKMTERALGRALVDASTSGTSNSTTAGSAQGYILNEQITNANKNLLNAINFSNDTSRANIGAQLNTLGSLANLIYPIGTASNANLMTALGATDATNLANTNAINQVNAANTQMMNEAAQRRQQSLSNMIGGGVGMLGSLALAPTTGGGSLLGNLFNKGAGIAASPGLYAGGNMFARSFENALL